MHKAFLSIMRISLFAIFCSIISASSFAQNDSLPEFGKADIKELQMKECAFDKNAPAMKLLDLLQSEISVIGDVRIETERRVRIKIFNEKGFDFASINIP